MSLFPVRSIAVAAALALILFVPGCSLFRPARTVAAHPTAPDSTEATLTPADTGVVQVIPPTPPEEVPPAEPEPPPTAERKPPPSRPAEPGGPVLTVRMSAEEESALRLQISSDIDRATFALTFVRGRALTVQQMNNLTLAEDFLTRAQQARSSDLVRAGTLAEKARVLADELRSEVMK